MSGRSTDRAIQEYLDRVASQLSDLDAEERNEILDDLKAHIEESVSDLAHASEAEVRNALERLGDPVDLAREARERSSTAQPGMAAPVERRLDRTPGALEVAAIILTAIFWPIGVLLAGISPRWLTRDKVIATVIPAVGSALLLALLVGGLMVWDTQSSTTVQVNEQGSPAQPAEPGGPEVDERSPNQISETGGSTGEWLRLAVVFGFLIGAIASPFIAAAFLAIRLQPVEVRIYPDGRRIRDGVPAGGNA